MVMNNAREQLIETTAALVEAQGYHATGLSQILKESGTPKGSLYYYFPAGKEELAAEAIAHTAQLLVKRATEALAADDDPAAAIPEFIRTIAHYVEASDFAAGGPLITVALESVTCSERLNLACQDAYRRLQEVFAAKLQAGGYSATQATHLASFVTAAIEGGTLLSRTAHSCAVLRQIADDLGVFLHIMPKS